MSILSINVNFSVIGRALKRNFITIFMMSIILGCLSFVVIDYVVPQKYTTTVNLSVIAEGNVANNLSSRKLAAAVTRYVNVLDKDVMSKKICEDLRTDELPGKIEVSSIYGSNLVVVKCTSNFPRISFEMSQLFRKYYQSVASQLSGNYRITDLGVSNVNLISTSKSVSVIMAILIGLIVFVVECGLVILMKIFDGKVQDEKQAEREIDTSFIGTIRHAALIVVKQEKAKIVVINDMIDELEQEKMEVMGFVLNNVWSKQFSVNRYNNYYTKSREFADS